MHDPSKLTIAFTDSGLGGLSYLAKFSSILKECPSLPYKKIELVFFNSFAGRGHGYNEMKDDLQKEQTFNGALTTMQERYSPDIFAIVCNTLSTIYPKTAFAKSKNRVFEIISPGRSQISKHMKKFPEEPILIFATPTTINSGAYHFDNPNVIPVSGKNLASLIEADYKNISVKTHVQEMFQEAINTIGSDRSFSIFLGCTHYGYIQDLYFVIGKDLNLPITRVLDPRDLYIENLNNQIQRNDKSIYTETSIEIRIESQALIEEYEIESVSSLLQNEYPEITKILKNYTQLQKLF